MLEAKGIAGQLRLEGDEVIISRKGAFAFVSHGSKGEKAIHLTQIAAVQFKPAGMLSGYIQFTLPGGRESRGGAFDAAKDENSVMFEKRHQGDFENIRDAVKARLIQLRAPAAAASASPSDEIEKLAGLRDRGILTEEEFQAKKRQMLGL